MTDNDVGPVLRTRPDPDPTLLTTQQLLRELARAQEYNDAERRVILERIVRIEEVAQVRAQSIDNQFAAIEAWRKEQKVDTKTAVDAALTAASTAVREQTAAGEKAIAKSEASASEQGKLQAATFTAELRGLNLVVTDVKDRVTKLEAMKSGAKESQAGLIAIVLAGIAVAGFMITLLTLLPK